MTAPVKTGISGRGSKAAWAFRISNLRERLVDLTYATQPTPIKIAAAVHHIDTAPSVPFGAKYHDDHVTKSERSITPAGFQF